MRAPEWFRNAQGPEGLRPPPPGMTAKAPPVPPQAKGPTSIGLQAYGSSGKPPPTPPLGAAPPAGVAPAKGGQAIPLIPPVPPKGVTDPALTGLARIPVLPTPPAPTMPEGRFHQSLKQGLVPALPSVPAAPPGTAVGQALPPLPALAILPPPPGAPDPGAPILLDAVSKPAGGAVALALAGMPGVPNPKQLALAEQQRRTTVSQANKSASASEKVFMIPGLQDRQYTEEEIQLAFEMMDLDRHKELDATDVRRVLDLCGYHTASDAEVGEMIRLFDPDGSGTVDFPEFRKNYINPPALFRNFDLHKREVLDTFAMEDDENAQDPASPTSGAQQSPLALQGTQGFGGTQPLMPQLGYTPVPNGKDDRIKAVELIIGPKRKLRPEYIKQVYTRFVELDTDEVGTISYLPFCMALKRPPSNDMRAAFDIFDYKRTGELDLRELVVSLSMFTKSSVEDKIKFAFMMFDENQWNTLNRTDLSDMLQAMAPHLLDSERDEHVTRLYSLYSLHPRDRVNQRQVAEYLAEYAEKLVPGAPARIEPDTPQAGNLDDSGSGTADEDQDLAEDELEMTAHTTEPVALDMHPISDRQSPKSAETPVSN